MSNSTAHWRAVKKIIDDNIEKYHRLQDKGDLVAAAKAMRVAHDMSVEMEDNFPGFKAWWYAQK